MLRATLALTALVAVAAPSANAAILRVDTNTDVAPATPADCTDNDAATPCSIRDALAAAAGTTEDDRVEVPADDYVLNGTSLQVTGPGNVTIKGAATTTISGNDASTVLDVFTSATIESVTIRDGRAPLEGGGIFVHDGTLTIRDSVIESNEAGTAAGQQGQGGGVSVSAAALRLERSVVRDNRAGLRGGGIFSAQGSAPVTLVDSTVAENRVEPATAGSAGGGGIWAYGDLNLTRVALTDNTALAISTTDEGASAGGAILLAGGTITDSTITGNHATGTGVGMAGGEGRGGGLYLTGSDPVQITGTTLAANTASATAGAAEGGAIRHFAGTLTITNSTISGNSVSATAGANTARGGGAVIDTPATLTNVTIANNTATGPSATGGNLSMFDAALRNTLVAGGVPGNCEFTVASAVGSLDTGTSCGLGAGNRSAVANPRLGPLAANGGPTLTHALLSGSPAIDTGTNTGAPTTDQRGIRRPQRDGVDIGAYELVGPATPRPGPAPDRTAPTFADLDLTRHVFRARRGTTVLYELSEAAAVTFRIQRRTAGRRVNGRCVKRTRSNRTRPRCVRYVRVGAARTQRVTAGANRLRLRTRGLKPGRYRLLAVAVDLTGNRSARSRIPFRILAKR
jgi:parallel beta helix pectate lyase-like protein